MATKKQGKEKVELHQRNKNRTRYDLEALIAAVPALKTYLKTTPVGSTTIDFSNAIAVKLLNTAILKHYYHIGYWDFPQNNLCPPIPGRAEYIHHIADLLGDCNKGIVPTGASISCLDIGIGASCIYPLIGVIEYGWQFIGSDIDPTSITHAEKIIQSNPALTGKVTCILQQESQHLFRGIIHPNEAIDVSICNPPFHASLEELQKGNQRKVRNLTKKQAAISHFNFSGNHHELIYPGGEYQFIKNMIKESRSFAQSVYWFTTLVSKASNLKGLSKELNRFQPTQKQTITIKTGNKTSRILAWSYLSPVQQKEWREKRW